MINLQSFIFEESLTPFHIFMWIHGLSEAESTAARPQQRIQIANHPIEKIGGAGVEVGLKAACRWRAIAGRLKHVK